MSWRAGFFRIWVLLTVIYLLLVALFSYNGIVSPWVSQQRAFVFRANLSDLRATTPEYADLDEKQLADAVYRKFYSDMPRPEFDSKVEKAKLDAPDVVEEYSSEYRDLEKLVTEGKMLKIEFEGVPDIFMFFRQDAPKETLKRRAKEVHPLALELRENLIHEKRVEAIWGALGAAFFPPVILLLLGLAVAWVIAGFRRSQSNP
jgi:hypothetical protein